MSPFPANARSLFLTEMKREEKSFNLHQLLYADNKESFQCKWSIQQKSVREKQTGRTREVNKAASLVWEAFHRSLFCETVPLLDSVLPTVQRKTSCWALSINCQSVRFEAA